MGKYSDEKLLKELLEKYEVDETVMASLKTKIEQKKLRLNLKGTVDEKGEMSVLDKRKEEIFSILVTIFDSTRLSHVDLNNDERIYYFINSIEVKVNFVEKFIEF